MMPFRKYLILKIYLSFALLQFKLISSRIDINSNQMMTIISEKLAGKLVIFIKGKKNKKFHLI
jgi:hypothetical protein